MTWGSLVNALIGLATRSPAGVSREFRADSQGYAQGMTSLGYLLSGEEFPPVELVRQAVRAESGIAPELAA
jgi:hypothetical protein